MRTLIRSALRPDYTVAVNLRCTLRLSRPSGRSSYHVFVSAIPLQRVMSTNRRGGVALFISDPDVEPQPAARALRGAFGLSEAESRFAAAVASGLTIRAVADELRIKMSTARWFVRQLFSKTDTRTLPQLTRSLIGAVSAGYASRDPNAGR